MTTAVILIDHLQGSFKRASRTFMTFFPNQIFVYCGGVDMRKSINGLSILVKMSQKTFDLGNSFVFLNKKRDKIKILVKENNGFVLLYKRLDAGKFKISFASKTEIVITQSQLRYLLDGHDYVKLSSLKKPTAKHYF